MLCLKGWQKGLFFAFFLFLYLFFAPKPIVANWVKNLQNPILYGTPGWWDSSDALCSNVIFGNEIYRIWYTGSSGSGWDIGYAYSADGITAWQKHPSPIIQRGSSDGWERDVAYPNILIENNNYKMWYVSIGPNWMGGPDRARLRYATSVDGLNWNEGDWVLRGTLGEWDGGAIDRGLTIIKKEGTYQMWYAGGNEEPIGSSGEEWRIGYATSADGVNWVKHPGNPVIEPTESWELNSVSYPNVIYEGGVYYMWYAATTSDLPRQIVYATSTDGINWQKPADQNPALTRGPYGSFDDVHVASPFVIKQGNLLKMWYDGFDGSRWRIGYAENSLAEPPEESIIVLLPGLGASWHYQAILTGQPAPQNEWRMTPGIRVYNGLIKTLENAGFAKDQELFIFHYDWRQPVANISQDLADYLEGLASEDQIILIGHSLGGLVARTYAQNSADEQISKVVSLGSPHQGVLKAYYPWEGGTLDQFSPAWQRIGLGLLLHINRPYFISSVQVMRSVAPVLKDLLPTFAYLEQDGIPRLIPDMHQQNDWLAVLNDSADSQILDKSTAFAGIIPDSTLLWLRVQPPSWFESLLGYWEDGKPTGSTVLGVGDKTVLGQSAGWGDNFEFLNDMDHTQLVTQPEAQEKLMTTLGLEPSAISDLSVGLNYEPGLVLVIASPATISVFGPDGQPVGEGDDKMIIVTDAAPGTYRVEIAGIGDGSYQLLVGQITDSGDHWSTLAGKIEAGQQKEHLINFQPENPLSTPHSPSIRQKIINLRQFIWSKNMPLSLKLTSFYRLNTILRLVDKDLLPIAIRRLYQLRQQFWRWYQRGKINSDLLVVVQNQIMLVIEDLEQLYVAEASGNYPARNLQRELKQAEKAFQKMAQKFENMTDATEHHAALYVLAQEKLTAAQQTTGHEAHIKALGVRLLAQEGLILY